MSPSLGAAVGASGIVVVVVVGATVVVVVGATVVVGIGATVVVVVVGATVVVVVVCTVAVDKSGLPVNSRASGGGRPAFTKGASKTSGNFVVVFWLSN
jgi:hypothetical protein